jgi:NADPH:quinone reductase-like Zn-dependent oxidoreductase
MGDDRDPDGYHARAANPYFWRFFAGLRRPRWGTLGIEFAGLVKAVGSAVTEFHVGDRVFGTPRGFGAHAELMCLRERPIATHAGRYLV